MIEAGIDDGDMVIVDADKEASIGDKVVALDGEGQSTLKTLLYDTEQSSYYLHPENHLLADIYVARGDDFQAQQYLLSLQQNYRVNDDIQTLCADRMDQIVARSLETTKQQEEQEEEDDDEDDEE